MVTCIVAGCSTDGVPDSMLRLGEPAPAVALQKAQKQFSDRNYGRAIEVYKASVEKDPQSAEAWLGLAASYDQIGRFDLADKAYKRVTSLVGNTPTVLNNKGYSFLLRGKLLQSQAALISARSRDPGNPYIQSNIDLLNTKLASLGRPPVPVN